MNDGPILVHGVLGWRNPTDPVNPTSYEAYGPGGRWGKDGDRHASRQVGGDSLAGALTEAGASEGAHFIVVAFNRFDDKELGGWEAIEARIRQALMPA